MSTCLSRVSEVEGSSADLPLVQCEARVSDWLSMGRFGAKQVNGGVLSVCVQALL